MRILKAMFVFLTVGAALGGSGFGKAQARKDRPVLRVSLAIPQICEGGDGKPAMPGFLPVRYATERFTVVIENISDKPVQVWADGNSVGAEILTFEVTGPDGKAKVVRPIPREYSKNIFRTERLLPGETCVRDVSYNASPPQWEGFPLTPAGTPNKVTLRAILTQTPLPNNKNPELWSGKAASPPLEIVFE